MATFADMCTLLLTFFIIMLSMSNTDVVKFRAMLGSIKDAFGVQFENVGDYQATLPDDPRPTKEPGAGQWQQTQQSLGDDTGFGAEIEAEVARKKQAEEAIKRQEEKSERVQAVNEIKDAIQDQGMGEQAEVQMGARGIRIRVKGALLFDPGQGELRPEAMPFLENLIEVLKKFDYFLLVEGHTDALPISTAHFPSNWELSGFRASTVLRLLIDQGVSPLRLTAVGLADNFPLDSNDTSEGRARNRRVEFVLTKQPFRPQIN
jgi:chemotaxis protein MotB